MVLSGQVLQFYQLYIELHEKDKQNFSRLVHKLLHVNFLTKEKESDDKDYYYLFSHFDLFKIYFMFMDCELCLDTNYHVFYLQSNQGSNRLNLRLNESILLLILRMLYDEKMREVSLSNHVLVLIEDIHDKFLSTGLQDRRISKTELKQILNLFSRFNLIEILDHQLTDDNSRIILYPTLLFAVNINDINEVYEKLISYKKEGKDDETIGED